MSWVTTQNRKKCFWKKRRLLISQTPAFQIYSIRAPPIGWIFIRIVFSWSQNAEHAKQHVFIGEKKYRTVRCENKFAHAHVRANSHVCDVRAKRSWKRAYDVCACVRAALFWACDVRLHFITLLQTFGGKNDRKCHIIAISLSLLRLFIHVWCYLTCVCGCAWILGKTHTSMQCACRRKFNCAYVNMCDLKIRRNSQYD